jgi:stringent starvation protein B
LRESGKSKSIKKTLSDTSDARVDGRQRDASVDGVSVPPEHVKDGKIILNISESAAHNLKLVNDSVSFRARFGGVPFDVWVPTGSILGIYARETGQGMIFSNDSGTSDSVRNADDVEETRSRPHLRVVK